MAGKRDRVEARLNRKVGMTDEQKAAMVARFRGESDIYTICPKCGHRRLGSWTQVTSPCPKCRGSNDTPEGSGEAISAARNSDP